jgi:hypothetical protein
MQVTVGLAMEIFSSIAGISFSIIKDHSKNSGI